MSLDAPLATAGLFIGIIVGLTGMGGGALVTPMLVCRAPEAVVADDEVAIR